MDSVAADISNVKAFPRVRWGNRIAVWLHENDLQEGVSIEIFSTGPDAGSSILRIYRGRDKIFDLSPEQAGLSSEEFQRFFDLMMGIACAEHQGTRS